MTDPENADVGPEIQTHSGFPQDLQRGKKGSARQKLPQGAVKFFAFEMESLRLTEADRATNVRLYIMKNHFFAYLSRMKLIERWSLMRSTQKENVQEHSLQVAVIAHALGVIKNKHFQGKVNVERVALLSLYHDATEVLTGDLPTPVKYFNPEIRKTYKEIERHAADQLLQALPEDLRGEYLPMLNESEKDRELWDIVKAADKICAYIKCLEEKSSGNPEFSVAEKTLLKTIRSIETPEVSYFMKTFVPSFSKNLDEMSEDIKAL